MRPMNGFDIRRCLLLLIVALITVSASLAAAADKKDSIGGLSPEEALKAGAKMYYHGILPSGKTLAAIVHGDIEITGDQSPCSSCHLYSGLGSFEGGVLTTPTNGAKLYAPLSTMMDIPGPYMNRGMFQYKRPAYTDETLADALILGVSPSGRTLVETMPRYILDQNETDILIYFLKHLSSTIDPGVDDKQIRFSIIVSDKISAGDRDSMITPLLSFFKNDWNARLDLLRRQWNARWLGGEVPKELRYREAVLEVWELKGEPDSWGKQLEQYYKEKPVFAVLGGRVTGKWEPIHRFCEANRVPCIFPMTDLPVVSSSDWYTLYLSKGYYQEGETAAKYLSRVIALPDHTKVVQVYRESDEGETLARGFTETWKKLGDASVSSRVVLSSERTDKEFWRELAEKNPGAVMLIWLPAGDLAGAEEIATTKARPNTLFFSSTMLSRNMEAIPDNLRDFSLVTWPTRLPGEDQYPLSLFNSWMNFKKLSVSNAELSSEIFFITRVLLRALVDMGTDFYREFFMDMLDCGKDQAVASVRYPMLSFGPSQRYASKGCFVVSVTKGKSPKVIRQSDWVVY